MNGQAVEWYTAREVCAAEVVRGTGKWRAKSGDCGNDATQGTIVITVS